jgi:RecA/RadA recombinase
MSVDASKLDATIAAIKKKRGVDSIHTGEEQIDVDHIPIGIPGIDRITGGGFPIGRMTRMYGGPSSGKSLIGWALTRASHDLRTERFPDGLEVVYHNIEKQYTKDFTRERGVDVERLRISQGTIIEEVAQRLELLLPTAHVHILDSCSAAVSLDELEAGPDEWRPGINSRVWGKVLRNANERFDKDENALVYIDHARQAFGQSRGSEHAPGGSHMEHASSMTLKFTKGTWLVYNKDGFLDKITDSNPGRVGLSGSKQADGIEITVYCEKSRVCRPLRTAKLRLDLNTFEFDRWFELSEAATFFDYEGYETARVGSDPIVQANGAWYTLPDMTKVQGKSGLRAAIREDSELEGMIMTAMLADPGPFVPA